MPPCRVMGAASVRNVRGRLQYKGIAGGLPRAGVIFTAGDIFFTDGAGQNTLRLGFSRVADEDIVRGIAIIGKTARTLMGE